MPTNTETIEHFTSANQNTKLIRDIARLVRRARLDYEAFRRVCSQVRKEAGLFVGGGEKGYQFGGRKGASGAVTRWTTTARSKPEADSGSRRVPGVVAVRQL
ncbi:MAG: hypothetical protein ABIZ80_17200 [Bryobacteraceae bacterium]